MNIKCIDCGSAALRCIPAEDSYSCLNCGFYYPRRNEFNGIISESDATIALTGNEYEEGQTKARGIQDKMFKEVKFKEVQEDRFEEFIVKALYELNKNMKYKRIINLG